METLPILEHCKGYKQQWQITNLHSGLPKACAGYSTITGYMFTVWKGLQMCGLDEALINKVKNNCRDFRTFWEDPGERVWTVWRNRC